MDKTADEVQGLIDLTPPQKAAWAQLARAINRCKKENIYFYQVLDGLGGLNGNNVEAVKPIEETDCDYGCPEDLQNLLYPSVNTCDSWADDTHVVILKDEQ